MPVSVHVVTCMFVSQVCTITLTRSSHQSGIQLILITFQVIGITKKKPVSVRNSPSPRTHPGLEKLGRFNLGWTRMLCWHTNDFSCTLFPQVLLFHRCSPNIWVCLEITSLCQVQKLSPYVLYEATLFPRASSSKPDLRPVSCAQTRVSYGGKRKA